MAESEAVLEGFICPMCMTDWKTPHQLTKHFEESHDDPEILKSLKDLFVKAKKKIMKEEDVPDIFSDKLLSHKEKRSPDIVWGPQDIGATKSHTQYFREVRNIRLERYATETNKLLIRLDKLLNNLPMDPTERKVHERAIVPWIDDKDVRLCPMCAKSFHMARRKHHCRLCGAIMCKECSVFLPLEDARSMTSPVAVQDDTALPSITKSDTPGKKSSPGMNLVKLKRTPSSASLNSVLSLNNDITSNEKNFRLCIHCINLLEARERLKSRQFDKPIVCQFYEKMRSYIEEGDRYLDMYHKMWDSLKEGETTYDLQDAQVLRVKIGKVGENIDGIAKRIVVLGSREPNSSQEELRLHQMVRMAAMKYLKDYLLSIPTLPTEEEYKRLQEKRDERLAARIAYEQQLEQEQREKSREQTRVDQWNTQINNSPGKNNRVMDQSQGWGPSGAAFLTSTSMDPIIEQMSNLRSYIKQARSECKYDEVATLENNLRELQSAYFAMKESNNGDN